MIDVVGSSDLWRRAPHAMLPILDALLARVHHVARRFRGSVLKAIGDAFMVEHASLADGVRAAIALQEAMVFGDPIRVGRRRLRLRCGVASGDAHVHRIEVQGCTMRDLFGDTVNVASRMESKVAAPDGVAFVLPAEGGEAALGVALDGGYGVDMVTFTTGRRKAVRPPFVRSERVIPHVVEDTTVLRIGRPRGNVNAIRVLVRRPRKQRVVTPAPPSAPPATGPRGTRRRC